MVPGVGAYTPQDIDKYRKAQVTKRPDVDDVLLTRCFDTIKKRVEDTYGKAESVMFSVDPLLIPLTTLDVPGALDGIQTELRKHGYTTIKVSESCILISWVSGVSGVSGVTAIPRVRNKKPARQPVRNVEDAWRFR